MVSAQLHAVTSVSSSFVCSVPHSRKHSHRFHCGTAVFSYVPLLLILLVGLRAFMLLPSASRFAYVCRSAVVSMARRRMFSGASAALLVCLLPQSCCCLIPVRDVRHPEATAWPLHSQPADAALLAPEHAPQPGMGRAHQDG